MPSEDSARFMLTTPLAELEDKKALIRLYSDYEQAVANKRDDITRNERYRNIYKTLDPPEERLDETTGLIEDNEDYYANTFMPIGAAIADSAVTQIYSMLFATNEYVRVVPKTINDYYRSEIVQAHLLTRLKEMKFRSTIYRVLQQMACFDYAVTGTRWLLQEGYVAPSQQRQEVLSVGNLKTVKNSRFAEPRKDPDAIDRSDVFHLDFFRCYHDNTAEKGLEDSRYFFDERWVRVEELIANSEQNIEWGKYKNIDKVVDATVLEIQQELNEIEDTDVRREFVHSRKIKVIRCWTENHLIEFAEGHIIRRMNLHGWPIQIWRAYPEPGNFRGMSFLQRLERNQLDINASLNARRNFQNIVSNPFGVVDKSLISAKSGTPRLYPGWLGVSRGGDVREKIYVYTPGQNLNADAMSDVKLQIEMTERQAGTSGAMQGAVSDSRTSATEINAVERGALGRMDVISERLEIEDIEPIAINIFRLEQMNLSREESFLYNGVHADQFFVIGPSHLAWEKEPTFQIQGTAHFKNDALQTNQFMTAIQIVSRIPQLAQKANWNNIGIELFRRLMPRQYFQFMNDPNVPTENIPPELENMMMAMGNRVQPSPLNNHAEHIQKHQAVKNTPDYRVWPEAFKQALELHINEHVGVGAAQGRSAADNGPSVTRGLAQQDEADPFRGLGIGNVAGGAA